MTPDQSHRSPPDENARDDGPHSAIVVRQIAEALQGLKFGQVTITVQDGIVVQIDRLERTRLKRRGK